MTCVHTDDFSPSQIGIASTRMSDAITCSNSGGQSSRSQPCSVMSGHTPVAISWSMARTHSTVTPWRRMISIDRSTRPCVCDSSGERFSVQLTNSARRSLKSHCDCAHSASCLSLSVAISPSTVSSDEITPRTSARTWPSQSSLLELVRCAVSRTVLRVTALLSECAGTDHRCCERDPAPDDAAPSPAGSPGGPRSRRPVSPGRAP